MSTSDQRVDIFAQTTAVSRVKLCKLTTYRQYVIGNINYVTTWLQYRHKTTLININRLVGPIWVCNYV